MDRDISAQIIDCDVSGWGFQLLSYLKEQCEVDLIHVHFEGYAKFFEDAARRFSMTMEHDRDSGMIRFRKIKRNGASRLAVTNSPIDSSLKLYRFAPLKV